jgi:DNA replication protein DnaC
MRQYDRRREENRHRAEESLALVHRMVSGYRDLENEIAAVYAEATKKYLSGDEEAHVAAKQRAHDLIEQKNVLLTAAGLSADFLIPRYNCPDCRDTGYIDRQKCHCLKQAIINVLYQQSGIRMMLEKENFAHLEYGYHSGEHLTRFQNAVAKCRKFCEQFSDSYSRGCQNLYLYGTVGTGKTFLSACVAKHLIDGGYSVIYYTASDLFDTLSAHAFDYKKKDEFQELRGDLSTCDLLIIDDLGTEPPSNFSSSQLFVCLNSRHLHRKATIISTNLSLEEVNARYADRIFSRIFANFELLHLSGADIRIQKKRSREQKGTINVRT